MKLSQALLDGIKVEGLEAQSFHRGPNGFKGELSDRRALAAWLLDNPARDTEVEVREFVVIVGEKTVRPGQRLFRKKVGDAYGWKCAITGEAATPALQAAHLAEYDYKEGHNEACHGIFLRADLHKLMDEDPPLLRIVRENGELVVRVAPEAGPDYGKLNGKKIRIPKRKNDRPAL